MARIYVKSLLAKNTNPNAHIGAHEMHQAKTSNQLELIDHQTRVCKDEIHLRKSKCCLQNGIYACEWYKNITFWRLFGKNGSQFDPIM